MITITCSDLVDPAQRGRGRRGRGRVGSGRRELAERDDGAGGRAEADHERRATYKGFRRIRCGEHTKLPAKTWIRLSLRQRQVSSGAIVSPESLRPVQYSSASSRCPDQTIARPGRWIVSAIRRPWSNDTPGSTRESAAATPSNVLWLSFRTMTFHESPSRRAGAARGALDGLRHGINRPARPGARCGAPGGCRSRAPRAARRPSRGAPRARRGCGWSRS